MNQAALDRFVKSPSPVQGNALVKSNVNGGRSVVEGVDGAVSSSVVTKFADRLSESPESDAGDGYDVTVTSAMEVKKK